MSSFTCVFFFPALLAHCSISWGVAATCWPVEQWDTFGRNACMSAFTTKDILTKKQLHKEPLKVKSVSLTKIPKWKVQIVHSISPIFLQKNISHNAMLLGDYFYSYMILNMPRKRKMKLSILSFLLVSDWGLCGEKWMRNKSWILALETTCWVSMQTDECSSKHMHIATMSFTSTPVLYL